MARTRATSAANDNGTRAELNNCTTRWAGLTLRQPAKLSAPLGVDAYDAYVIPCAMNHLASVVMLAAGMAARPREWMPGVPRLRVR